MYTLEQHGNPHIHAEYGSNKASIAIDDGEILVGWLPPTEMRRVKEWLTIRREELLTEWQLAAQGILPRSIEPLQ